MIRKRSRAQRVQNRRIERNVGLTLAPRPWPTLLACIAHRIGVANPILGGERLATAIGT